MIEGLPVHPAIVHVPIGLAVLLPFAALAIALAITRGWLPRRTWVLVPLLNALVLGSGLVAMETGEHEEDQVKQMVHKSLIKEHEERAEWFMWLAGASLAVGAATLFLRNGTPAVAGVALTILLAAGAAAAVAWTGHLGGTLVFVHGAASAYHSSPTPLARPEPAP